MLSVVIVSYQARELLAGCLEALAASPPAGPWEAIVVDNASADGSAAMVRARFPAVRLVANDVNVGFGRAADQGAAMAAGDLVCFLNPDALVGAGALARLAAVLAADPRVGAVGPRMVTPGGTPVRSAFRFPTLIRPLLDVRPMRRLLGAERVALAYDLPDPAAVREVDWVSGACLMTRRALLERLGAFDPAFFMYFEDVDLCRRLRRAGLEVRYVGDAVVGHHTRGSSRGALTPALFLAEQRSRLHYYGKHHGALGALVIRALAAAAALWRILTLPFRRSLAPTHDTLVVNLKIAWMAIAPSRRCSA